MKLFCRLLNGDTSGDIRLKHIGAERHEPFQLRPGILNQIVFHLQPDHAGRPDQRIVIQHTFSRIRNGLHHRVDKHILPNDNIIRGTDHDLRTIVVFEPVVFQYDIPDGTVAAALMHSASIFVRIDVEGLSSHASRPHLGVNCAEMLAAIVQNAGLLKFAPTLTWSMKCTKIDVGGAAINVIPDKGYCMYDVRAQTNPLMKDMLEKLEKSAQSTAAAFGGKAKMTLLGDVIPACEYDDELVKEMSDCIAETLGADKLRATSIGGGEDFHFFKIKKPSLRTAYIGVGAGATPGLHHPDMKLNPESLINGVKVMEAFALKYLG